MLAIASSLTRESSADALRRSVEWRAEDPDRAVVVAGLVAGSH